MTGEQKCPICAALVDQSHRYPSYVCSDCWAKAVDETGRRLGFGFLPKEGYCVWYEDTKEPRKTGICYIDGIPCWAGEDYWGGTVVAYPYEGEK